MPFYVNHRVASILISGLYHSIFSTRLSFVAQRRALNLSARLVHRMPKGALTETITLGGVPAERITVGASSDSSAILYLHGGGYTSGSPTTHRSLAAHIARDAGVPVYLPDYRLAPEHPFPAAIDDAVAAALDLVKTRGLAPGRLAIAGDSAGGGLSVATARRLIDDHGIAPAGLALIAPWVDPLADSDRKRDVVLTKVYGDACAAAYLGDGDPKQQGFAPTDDELTGLPPTLIQVGMREILYDQVVEFASKLEAANVSVTLTADPTMWHVEHAQAFALREAARSVAALSAFLAGRLDAAVVEPSAGDVG